jgi:hypothetical protein
MKPVIKFNSSQFDARVRKLIKLQPQKKRAALQDIAVFLEGEVKDHTAVDEGHLTENVRGEVQEDGNRMAAVIKIPANSQASQYAIPMHENNYKLGKKSLDKRSKTGKPVGKKYISNPIDNNHDTIREIAIHKLKV